MWNRERGISKLCRAEGRQAAVPHEKRLMNDVLPALSKKYDLDTSNNVNPLPSFVMAKKIQQSCVSMLKEMGDMKKEGKRAKLITDMNVAEVSVCIGLEKHSRTTKNVFAFYKLNH